MSSKPFDEMTDDEQDEVAKSKIRELLSKPELEEGDAVTVAACVAFIGTSQKIADNVSQALLDSAESLTTGLCVRCGSEVGKGSPDCLICQGIRNVQTLKLVERNGQIKTEKPGLDNIDEAGDLGEPVEMEGIDQLEPARVPWTDQDLERLKLNRHVSLNGLAWLFKNRTTEEIKEKLVEVFG